jgi:hypothetical protein
VWNDVVNIRVRHLEPPSMSDENDQLLMLYEQATQDIRTFQDRQTSLTYFTILTFAALVAAADIVADYGPPWLAAYLPAVTIVVAVISLGWLFLLQRGVHRARGKVERVRRGFSDTFKTAHGEPLRSGWLEAWDTLPMLILVVVVGAAITHAIVTAVLTETGDEPATSVRFERSAPLSFGLLASGEISRRRNLEDTSPEELIRRQQVHSTSAPLRSGAGPAPRIARLFSIQLWVDGKVEHLTDNCEHAVAR